MRKGRGEAGETVTGGRAATVRHVFGERVLSICMPKGKDHPRGWRWVALSDVAQMESGHTPSRNHPEYWGGDIPWISVKDARLAHGKRLSETEEYTNSLGIANSSARLLPEGTVCLSRGGTVGYVVILDKPMATSQGFANWICGPQLIPEFLQYLLLAEAESLEKFSIGTTIKTIYYPDLKAFHVCLPPLAEQKRIVALLDQAFAGIDEAMAKAEASFRDAKALFESHLQSVFSTNGTGWSDESVEDLVADAILAKPFDGNHGEIHPKQSDYTPEGIPFIMARDLQNGHVDTTSCIFISEKLAKSLRVGFAKMGDVLISHKGTIGRSAIVDKVDGEYIMLTPQVTSYRIIDTSRLSNRFLRYYFMSPEFLSEMISGALDGSTRAYIGITKQLKLRLRFPSLVEQIRILERMEALELETQKLTSIYERKLPCLDALKKSLLTQAFAGELTA